MPHARVAYALIALGLTSQALASPQVFIPPPDPPKAACFSGGQSSHNQDFAKNQVQDICQKHLVSKYTKDQERHFCFKDGEKDDADANNWILRAQNTGDGDKDLASKACVDTIKLIMDECIPYGGKKNVDDFEFT